MASNEIKITFTIPQYDELIQKLKLIAEITCEIVDNLDVIHMRSTGNNGEE